MRDEILSTGFQRQQNVAVIAVRYPCRGKRNQTYLWMISLVRVVYSKANGFAREMKTIRDKRRQ
eukprot:1547080-Rhodomonas_salina.1